MHPIWLLVCILFPFAAGMLLYLLHIRSYRLLVGLSLGVTVLTSLGCLAALLFLGETGFEAIRFAPNLVLFFRLDGLGRFFVGIVAALWPLTMLYAISYMRHEKHLGMFFGFFTAAYGATLGVAMAGNLFTMYCFYELLTLTTVPLVLQPMTHESRHATRAYFLFSIGGAAFAFISMMFLLANGAYEPFAAGGVLSAHPFGNQAVTLLFWLLGFFGFGVKAAIFPLHIWLPKASVAPTPVTALLHAVAVVKAGAFAVIRLTYHGYGVGILAGSWAQTVALLFAAFTIVFGSVMALKETHFKRRLAYSTVSNLSYILFGAMLMTPAGAIGALLHMASHACIKILAFFAAGAVKHQTGREWVAELDGLGAKMPVTFACFTVAAFALMGLPPFNGFVSKWYLLTAAGQSGWIGYVGAGALLLSALLTAIYMLSACRRAWFPDQGADLASLQSAREADACMLAPMLLLALGTLACGVFAGPILGAVRGIAAGL